LLAMPSTGSNLMAMPTTSPAASSSGGNTVTIQSVTVQASTPDILTAIQKKMSNMGYLGSGTRSTMMGNTRSQYGH
jgi:hypothetical protein